LSSSRLTTCSTELFTASVAVTAVAIEGKRIPARENATLRKITVAVRVIADL